MARAKGAKRLDLVVELASRKRKEADLILQQSRSRLDQALQGLAQLEAFLTEYVESTRLPQGASVSAVQLQMPAAFLGRLRGSIEQQHQVIDQYRRQHAEVENWWRAFYAREKAIVKLQHKLQVKEIALEEKQLQREIDELWQNRPSNPV